MNPRIRSTMTRTGHTLTEVLVVIAIILSLIGFLLPATQRVREAAQRARCANNLKQLGLALHAYQDQLGVFPQAYNEYWNLYPPTDNPVPPDSNPRKSWAALILPFVEQENLERLGAADFQSYLVDLFICPSDPRSRNTSNGGDFAYLGNQFGLTSYLAVESSSYEFGLDVSRAFIQLGGPKDGVLHRSSRTRIVQISDGSSNTLLLGERPPSPGPEHEWGWWAWSVYDSSLAAVDHRLLVYDPCPDPAVFSQGNLNDPCDSHHFWSFHPGGGNFCMADGSVHFFIYSGSSLLPALASRNGGEIVDLSGL